MLWAPILIPIHVTSIAMAYGSVWLVVRQPSPKRRMICHYLALNALAFLLTFIVANSVGGASMALVDGQSAYLDRLPGYVTSALKSLLMLQILIIPWTWFSLRLISERYPLPIRNSRSGG